MEIKVEQLLKNKRGSYVLPFFWQHGETEEVLREYMEAIYNANIYEVCIECRPHPDFCGPKWWEDMDVIMDEARKRGMKVWLLDDAHFPTGYANGGISPEADPHICKQYLNFATADVAGPTKRVNIDIKQEMEFRGIPAPVRSPFPMRNPIPARKFDTDKLLKVMAYQVDRHSKIVGDGLDITDYVENDMLTWDVPAGMWRIYVEFFTQNGGGRTDYINVLSRDSVRVLIDMVYEPTFERYKDDFGKTFRGYFSDEPLMGNFPNNYEHGGLIGTKYMAMPWCEEVPAMLEQRLGKDWLNLMPMLWDAHGSQELTGQVRHAYMDTITLLIEKNFSYQLGDWCRARGVEYIGHIVEDNNASASISSSMGHFFRSLDGQDMAGIDIIGGGVMPAGENRIGRGPGTEDAGDFYHFAIAKLASSHAHMDPKKKGRSMVELFGAYGWSFGISSMKYLTDHFLVRGVNRYVPHAFSPKDFPDPDCPPHFYAHGNNPQYRHFGRLMAYTQRVCHLIDGGLHKAPVALLHSDMALWAGKCMTTSTPARILSENQIDFDIIPSDILDNPDRFTFDGVIHINGETFSALVIPEFEFITQNVIDFANRAKAANFPVLFINSLPKYISEYVSSTHIDGTVVPLDELATFLRKKDAYEVLLNPSCIDIRYYHYVQDNDIYIFSNESTSKTYTGTIALPTKGDACMYDAWDNVLRPLDYTTNDNGTELNLTVKPYHPVIVVFGSKGTNLVPSTEISGAASELLDWQVSMCQGIDYPAFGDSFEMSSLDSIAIDHPDFSGFIRYEKSFDLPRGNSYVLELTSAYEGVEVWCNGHYVGMSVCPDHIFDITNFVQKGKNNLRIEVATTLDRKVRSIPGAVHPFVRQSIVAPTGLVGPVKIWTKY